MSAQEFQQQAQHCHTVGELHSLLNCCWSVLDATWQEKEQLLAGFETRREFLLEAKSAQGALAPCIASEPLSV